MKAAMSRGGGWVRFQESHLAQSRILPMQMREREGGKAIEPPRQPSSFTGSLITQARSFAVISEVCFGYR
jgi:hypothetical protein